MNVQKTDAASTSQANTTTTPQKGSLGNRSVTSGFCYIVVPSRIAASYMPWISARAVGALNAVTFRPVVSGFSGIGYGISKATYVAGKIIQKIGGWLGRGGANTAFQAADSIQSAVGEYSALTQDRVLGTAIGAAGWIGGFVPFVSLAAKPIDLLNATGQAAIKTNSKLYSLMCGIGQVAARYLGKPVESAGGTLADYAGRVSNWTRAMMLNPSQVNHALINTRDRMDSFAAWLADTNPQKPPRIPKCSKGDVRAFNLKTDEDKQKVLDRVCNSHLLNLKKSEIVNFQNAVFHKEKLDRNLNPEKLLRSLVSKNQYLVGKKTERENNRNEKHLTEFLKLSPEEQERNIFITLSSLTWELSYSEREEYQKAWERFNTPGEQQITDKNAVLEILYMWKHLPKEELQHSLSPDQLSTLQGFSNPISAQLQILDIVERKARLDSEERKVLADAKRLTQNTITGWQSLSSVQQEKIQRISLMHFNLLKHEDKQELLFNFSPSELEDHDIASLESALKDLNLLDQIKKDPSHDNYNKLSEELNKLPLEQRQCIKKNLTVENTIVLLTEKDLKEGIAFVEEKLKNGEGTEEDKKQLKQFQSILKERQAFVPIQDLQLPDLHGMLPAQKAPDHTIYKKLQEKIGSSVFTEGAISSGFQWMAGWERKLGAFGGSTWNKFCKIMGDMAPTATQLTAAGLALAVSSGSSEIVGTAAGASNIVHDWAMKIENFGINLRIGLGNLLPKIISGANQALSVARGGLIFVGKKMSHIPGLGGLKIGTMTNCATYIDPLIDKVSRGTQMLVQASAEINEQSTGWATLGQQVNNLTAEGKNSLLKAADALIPESSVAKTAIKATIVAGAAVVGATTGQFVVTPILLRLLGSSVISPLGDYLAPRFSTMWYAAGEKGSALPNWLADKNAKETVALGNFLQKYWNSLYGIDQARIKNFETELSLEEQTHIYQTVIDSIHIDQSVKDELTVLWKKKGQNFEGLDSASKNSLIASLLTAWDHLKPEEILAMTPASYSALPVYIQERIKQVVQDEKGLHFWERNNPKMIVEKFKACSKADQARINILSYEEYCHLDLVQQKTILFLVLNSEEYKKGKSVQELSNLYSKNLPKDEIVKICEQYSKLSPNELAILTPAQLSALSNEELLHAVDLIQLKYPELIKSRKMEYDFTDKTNIEKILTNPNTRAEDRAQCLLELAFLFQTLETFQQQKLLDFTDREIKALNNEERIAQKNRLFMFMLEQSGQDDCEIKEQISNAFKLPSDEQTEKLCTLFNSLPLEKRAEFRNYKQMVQSIGCVPLQKALKQIDKEINLVNTTYQENRRKLETLISARMSLKEPASEDKTSKATKIRAQINRFNTEANKYAEIIEKDELQLLQLHKQRVTVANLVLEAGGTVEKLSLSEDEKLRNFALEKIQEEISIDTIIVNQQIKKRMENAEQVNKNRITAKIEWRESLIKDLQSRLDALSPRPSAERPVGSKAEELPRDRLVRITEASICAQRIKFHECVIKEYHNQLKATTSTHKWSFLEILTVIPRTIIGLFKKNVSSQSKNKDQ